MAHIFKFDDTSRAISLQRELSSRIVQDDEPGFDPVLFCGMDVAYDEERAYVSASVWDAHDREFVERARSVGTVATRYAPGFLGFREGPLLVNIKEKLSSKPDVYLVDGHGFAHPRRFGLACHFGLAVDRPTVGVAKSFLYGRRAEQRILGTDGYIIGQIITTSSGKKYYVSVGHRISLTSATNVVNRCIVDNHPVPLRQAHLDCNEMKKDRGS